MTKTGSRAQIGICGFSRVSITEKTANVEFQQGIDVSWLSNKIPRVPTSSYDGETQALFYGSGMGMVLKCLLSELTFGNMGGWVEIPTYIRNDNSDASYQVDASNTVTNGARLKAFLESNKEEIRKNNWLAVGYITGDINTSDGLTKILSSANLRSLLQKTFPE